MHVFKPACTHLTWRHLITVKRSMLVFFFCAQSECSQIVKAAAPKLSGSSAHEILFCLLFQVERHHKTGEKEIDFPDGTRKYILPSGREMSEFPDGVTVVEYPEVDLQLTNTCFVFLCLAWSPFFFQLHGPMWNGTALCNTNNAMRWLIFLYFRDD